MAMSGAFPGSAYMGAGGGRDSQWSSHRWCCPALVVTALPYVAPFAAVLSPETRQEARARAVEAVWAAEAVRAAEAGGWLQAAAGRRYQWGCSQSPAVSRGNLKGIGILKQ